MSTKMNHGLPRLTIEQIHRLWRSGSVSCQQLASYCYTLATAGEEIWKLNAFERLVDRDELLDKAKQVDERRNRGEKPLSQLEGIPVSFKANIAVSSQPLTAGSKILGAGDVSNSTPNIGYDADVSYCLLNDCGALLMGITTQDEFGMGSLGSNVNSIPAGCSDPAPAKNPLGLIAELGGKAILSDECAAKAIRTPSEVVLEVHCKAMEASKMPHFSPGGSSCGSAISVSHGSSILSLGSDTGGSVRLPAAWCGIVGLKPSYGLLSRDGLVSYASSLDTIGILAPSTICASVALDNLHQHESTRDSTQKKLVERMNLLVRDEDYKELDGLTIGLPTAFLMKETQQITRDAWMKAARFLESCGAQTQINESIDPMVLQHSLSAYYVLAVAEASSNLARYDGFRYGSSSLGESLVNESESENMFTLLENQYATTRSMKFGNEVIRRIMCGTYVLSSDRFHSHYEAAVNLRSILSTQLNSALNECDVLLTPTCILPPPLLSSVIDPTESFANDILTVPFSLAGIPAVSVPIYPLWEMSPVPQALQLVSSEHDEHRLLRVAAALEVNNAAAAL